MRRWGLEVDYVDMTDLDAIEKNIKSNTRLLWLETPSNPMLLITDIASVCELAGEKVAVCVDNTWPTPVNQRPLKIGAGLVVHSTTKYLGGHSDLLGGAVIAREQSNLFKRVRDIQGIAGAVPSPSDCWLLSRSIRTLPYRVRAHNDNAKQVAEFLEEHDQVDNVYYPGLPSHAGYELAQKQMIGFGGMISFLVKGTESQTREVVENSKLVTPATSLGGVESTWEHRLSSEGEDSQTPANLIRISVGLEHPSDIKEDLSYALSILA
jgi:cystathionine gamma-synthase